MDRKQEPIERRLRGIYDAIDSRNLKGALKLCLAALEKHPHSPLVKAIYAYVLVRLKRTAEANQVCDDILRSGPVDEHAQHLLMLCLKDLRRSADITRYYEAAVAQDPSNPDALVGLFVAHCRDGALSKQQQVATKLNKLRPSARHAWWIVLSVMLQTRAALRGDAAAAMEPAKLMQLAEVMVQRQSSKDGRLDGFEALLVYLDLLLAQGKTRQALEVVEGPQGDVVSMSAERAHLQAALLMAAGDTPAAAQLLAAQLEAKPDDWASLLLFCECSLGPVPTDARRVDAAADGLAAGMQMPCWWPECSLLRLSGGLAELVHEPGAHPDGTAAAAMLPASLTGGAAAAGHEACVAMVARMVAAAEAEPGPGRPRLTMRGPYLASVEVAARAAAAGVLPTSAVVDAALEYIGRCSHMVSCAADLRPYWRGLDAAVRATLADRLVAVRDSALADMRGAASKTSQACARALRTVVCCWSVCGDLGRLAASSGDASGDAVAAELLENFSEAVASGVYDGLDERERGPADELPALAADALVAAAAGLQHDHEAVEYLLLTAALLEAAVQRRPYSAAYRLSLAALYCVLGAPAAVHRHVRHLEIKNIQMDTLAGHHLLPALLAFAPRESSNLTVLLNEILRLFDDHSKEGSVDTLAQAYQSGTYTKALEFVAFQERLGAAHTNALGRVEDAIRSIGAAYPEGLEACSAAAAAASSTLPADEALQLNARGVHRLRFNEDVKTRPCWAPPPAGPAQLTPTEWWSERHHLNDVEPPERWWLAAGGAAERGGEGGAAMRKGRAQALACRRAIPRLLAVLTASSPDVAELAADAERLCMSAARVQLSELPAALAAQAQEPPAGAAWGAAQALADTQLLLSGIFCSAAAMLPVLPAIASALDAASTVGPPDGASLATGTADFLLATCHRLSAAIHVATTASGTTHVLPGWILNVASVLLNEHCVWLVTVLQVWSRQMKSVGKHTSEELELAAASLSKLRKALEGACDTVAEALERFRNASSDHVSLLMRNAKLWEWQPGFDAAAATHAVQTEQTALAVALLGVVAVHKKALAPL